MLSSIEWGSGNICRAMLIELHHLDVANEVSLFCYNFVIDLCN